MNLLKFILGILLIIGVAMIKYYKIQGWQVPNALIYVMVAPAGVFLVLALLAFRNGPHRRIR